MRAIDLELRVIAAIDRILRDEQVESDFIECKRSWPQDNKARQLAGSLNRAAGDTVIYIIGIDEKTKQFHNTSGTDVLVWWSQISSQFDQVSPEMIRHMDVTAGPHGETVVAIAFSSDRAPYLVKTGTAKPSLEIPIREGTGTRTAQRDEVLRLLEPAVRVPSVSVLGAEVSAVFYEATSNDPDPYSGARSNTPEHITCNGWVRIFVEHDGNQLTTLPAHGMRGTLYLDGMGLKLSVAPDAHYSERQVKRVDYVVRSQEGVVVTGPGVVPLRLKALNPSVKDGSRFRNTATTEVRLELEILHASRPLKIEFKLSQIQGEEYSNEYFQPLNSWGFRHPGLIDE